MLKEATSEPLLYVAQIPDVGVDVLSYPGLKLVGQLTDIYEPQGVCSDASGNVYVTAFWTEDILEFAHGGTSPIAKLGDYGYYPFGCAVDPTTGDLAVANTGSMDGGGSLAIYKGARGSPTDYAGSFYFCAYDNKGNLLADFDDYGTGYEMLRAKSYSLQRINLNVPGYGIQWDGSYFAIIDISDGEINRVTVSGSTGTVHSTVKLKGAFAELGWGFALAGDKAIIADALRKDTTLNLATVNYPKGGRLSRPFKVDAEFSENMALSQ
jgi:hypothetical protein